MKKFMAILLLAALAFTLCGCEPAIGAGGLEELNGAQQTEQAVDMRLSPGGAIEITAEKTAYNRLTGLNDMAEDMAGKRPLAFEIDNIYNAWPQYGISDADILYEMDIQGGITRMLALCADIREMPKIGPLRSMRSFIEAAWPLEPIPVHWGNTIECENFFKENGIRSLDANYLPVGYRDKARMETYVTEHCGFTSPQHIYSLLIDGKIKEDLSAVAPEGAFNFAQPGSRAELEGGGARTAEFAFSSYADGDFRYDGAAQKYMKWQFGEKQMDAGSGEQLAFDNVFVIFLPIEDIYDGVLTKADFSHGGSGVYLTRGKYEIITWKKGSPTDNFKLFAASGEELAVNRGNSYMAFVRDYLTDELKIDGAPVMLAQ